MKKDKTRLILIAVLTASVVVSMILFYTQLIRNGNISTGNYLEFSIVTLVVIFMVFFIIRRFRDVKQGMPLEDERSKLVMLKATSISFFITLYWLLAIGMFEERLAEFIGVETLEASQATGAGIGGMAIAFVVSWLYFNSKGKLALHEK